MEVRGTQAKGRRIMICIENTRYDTSDVDRKDERNTE